MISSHFLRDLSCRLFSLSSVEACNLRRASRSLQNSCQSKVSCDATTDLGNNKQSYLQTKLKLQELPSLTNEKNIDAAEKQPNELVDKAFFTRADKQTLELAKVVPKENYVATFNLAAYVNKSETLRELYKLGVDLNKIEKRKGLGQFVLGLDFERDIKSHLILLHDIGIPAENFGEVLTKNPLIFKENLDDLQTRINYLHAKNFSQVQIQRVCTLNPWWLMFSTRRIDKRLGYFQQNFKLSGNDVRHLASKQPKLITYKLDHIRENMFCIKEEMGFDKAELKKLLLSKPNLWMMNREEIVERFDYAHNTMKLSHDTIIEFPEILTSRLFRTKQRHEFLHKLGKAQYDQNESEFISPKKLVEGTDEEFATEMCNSSVEEYESFLRTL